MPATPMRVELSDISKMGFQAVAPRLDLAKKGVTILLEIAPGETVAGQVAWHAGHRFGVIFDEPIDDRVVARVSALGDELPDAPERDTFGRSLPTLKKLDRTRAL